MYLMTLSLELKRGEMGKLLHAAFAALHETVILNELRQSPEASVCTPKKATALLSSRDFR